MTDIGRRACLVGVAGLTASLAGCMIRYPPAESIADTEYATAGSPPRRLVSTTDRQLAVPDDFETIQAAVDQLPLVMRHKWDNHDRARRVR